MATNQKKGPQPSEQKGKTGQSTKEQGTSHKGTQKSSSKTSK